jgi:hypothetical protein
MFTSCIAGAILCLTSGAMHIPGPLTYAAPNSAQVWNYATYSVPYLAQYPMVTVVRRS